MEANWTEQEFFDVIAELNEEEKKALSQNG